MALTIHPYYRTIIQLRNYNGFHYYNIRLSWSTNFAMRVSALNLLPACLQILAMFFHS